MELLQSILFIFVLYIAVILVISSVAALISMIKGEEHAKGKFKAMFWSLFLEMLNPFNWL